MNCPKCNRPMRVMAISRLDKNGNRWISYACRFCIRTVVKVKEEDVQKSKN